MEKVGNPMKKLASSLDILKGSTSSSDRKWRKGWRAGALKINWTLPSSKACRIGIEREARADPKCLVRSVGEMTWDQPWGNYGRSRPGIVPSAVLFVVNVLPLS
jgi:hypothetical protein